VAITNINVKEIQEFKRESITQPTLAEAQEYVGGLVEVVYCAGGEQLLVNEDGLLHKLPINYGATVYNLTFGNGQTLVGPVMLLVGDAIWV
jgi:hypothetical protein